MSAIVDSNDRAEPIRVLFALHPGFDSLDLTGPLEILASAAHDIRNKAETKAFICSTAGSEDTNYLVTSGQGLQVKVDMDFGDAHANLEEFDVLVILGGSTGPVLAKEAEPISLIKAWAELQKKDPSKERTLFSVCTGALYLAAAGVLQGLCATTHPAFYTELELMCQRAATNDSGIGTDVQEERYVVNNARFELGENLLENPFVFQRRPDTRRKSHARKGSDAFKLARRRESLVKRQNMPLGGLRVVTSSGVTAGLDAALYLVAALVSIESAQEVASELQFTWQRGVVIDSIDV